MIPTFPNHFVAPRKRKTKVVIQFGTRASDEKLHGAAVGLIKLFMSRRVMRRMKKPILHKETIFWLLPKYA
jgi:hypothetical protein